MWKDEVIFKGRNNKYAKDDLKKSSFVMRSHKEFQLPQIEKQKADVGCQTTQEQFYFIKRIKSQHQNDKIQNQQVQSWNDRLNSYESQKQNVQKWNEERKEIIRKQRIELDKIKSTKWVQQEEKPQNVQIIQNHQFQDEQFQNDDRKRRKLKWKTNDKVLQKNQLILKLIEQLKSPKYKKVALF